MAVSSSPFSVKRALSFTLCVWLFCFYYAAAFVPENWVARAHLLLQEDAIKHDILELDQGDRWLFGFNVAGIITGTMIAGFLLNVLHKQPDHTRGSYEEKKLKMKDDESASLFAVLNSYLLVSAISALYGVFLYIWCYYHFEFQLGSTYYFGSKMFTTASAFSRISSGFFMSVLALSYLDAFNLRANFGIPTPPQSSSVNRCLSLLALTGLGGMGGVAGATFMISRDIFSRALALCGYTDIDPSYLPMACVAILSALIVGVSYHMFTAPNYAKTKDSFNRKSAQFEAKRRKLFPCPYPNGWYGLCGVHELADGAIKSITCLGMDLVVFKGENGEVGVLDAHCPHIGAHLGQGGRVVGNSIECPFHNWRFNAEGQCTHIPYTNAPIPSMCNTNSHHTCVWGNMVYLWFDAEKREPTYEMEFPEEIDSGKWYYGGVTQLEFDQHVSEMAENSADYYHFATLHKPLPIPILGNLFTVDHQVKLIPVKEEGKTHTIRFDNDAAVYFGDKWIQLLPRQLMAVTFEGPAVVYFRMELEGLGTIFVVKTLLPLAPFHQYTEDRWWADKSVPRALGAVIALIARNALEQDREVWENKIYNKMPVLVQNDGPFPVFRRWYKQFYSEHSPDMASNVLDW